MSSELLNERVETTQAALWVSSFISSILGVVVTTDAEGGGAWARKGFANGQYLAMVDVPEKRVLINFNLDDVDYYAIKGYAESHGFQADEFGEFLDD